MAHVQCTPCVEKPDTECQHCKALTPEQLAQLSTPSYKLKKRDKSVTPSKDPTSSVTLSPTLVDPARVSVIRAVDDQDTGLSAQPAEKKKVEEKKSVKSKSSTSSSRLAAVSTNQKFEESDQFNRLEARLLAKTLDQPQQELTFNTVKVAPTHSPPVNVIRSEPFIKPTDHSSAQPTDRPSVSATTNPPASKPQADRPQSMD